MTHSSVDRENCLERARMHERLATTTGDGAARQMHQAMAAEFRRRAEQVETSVEMPPVSQGPVAGLYAAVG
jgi:hypothetical protein